ncbi:MAG: hypothetical protein KF782_13790, partial [Labilithrix sp.]|nr:hypothetical protein [Labilithrix sp.]
QRKGELLQQIEEVLVELANPELEKKVRDYLADPRVSVVEVWNQLSAKLGEKREQSAAGATEVQKQEGTES